MNQRAQRTVEEILASAREMLEMDIAYLSEFEGGVQCVREVDGDAESFGLAPGTEVALADSYCRRMVDGVIPNAISDTRRALWFIRPPPVDRPSRGRCPVRAPASAGEPQMHRLSRVMLRRAGSPPWSILVAGQPRSTTAVPRRPAGRTGGTQT